MQTLSDFSSAIGRLKSFTTPPFKDTAVNTTASRTVTIDASSIITNIPRSIAGNNANLWMTQMLTEAPLLGYINNLHPHIIRLPGGSIRDVFFWSAPRNTPPSDAPAQFLKAVVQ